MPQPTGDPTADWDNIAYEMREYYQNHKPLRWWQKRRRHESIVADNLMLGLLRVAYQGLKETGRLK